MQYSASQLKRAVEDPKLVLRELNRLYHTRVSNRGFNEDGVDFFQEDWDNLVILDACRYDLFAANNTLEGTLQRRQSRASSTEEFLRANVGSRQLHDTVYVTANPQLYRHRESLDTEFHDVRHIWEEDGWDDDTGTVLPETTTEYARRAAEKYPDKRLLVHYMQPHYPFIDASTEFDKTQLHENPSGLSFWDRLALDHIELDPEMLWELYEQNLRSVLPHVEELAASISGRTVITSDHGNMFGEHAFPIPFREWGHPSGIYTPELVEIPWLVREGESRRAIVAESPVRGTEKHSREVVRDRLENLGYAE